MIGRPVHTMARIVSSHLRYKIYTYVFRLKRFPIYTRVETGSDHLSHPGDVLSRPSRSHTVYKLSRSDPDPTWAHVCVIMESGPGYSDELGMTMVSYLLKTA